MGIKFSLMLLAVAIAASVSQASRLDDIRAINEKVDAQNPETLDDSELVSAMAGHQSLDYAQGGNLVVVDVQRDDKNGPQHQKWTVRLSNGVTMLSVYNLDMCERVPLKVGDRIAMGGQFIGMGHGGLLHWLHRAPKGNRPDGYVYLNGKYYCK
jgi:hypothetical protein